MTDKLVNPKTVKTSEDVDLTQSEISITMPAFDVSGVFVETESFIANVEDKKFTTLEKNSLVSAIRTIGKIIGKIK
ncbi:MAG TPA: hypothetical protein ENH95_06840 [Nitrosopumilus sp.]|nr:hypothetical protein [Nitrosopumilus sp.]